jgi:hypothetical protein
MEDLFYEELESSNDSEAEPVNPLDTYFMKKDQKDKICFPHISQRMRIFSITLSKITLILTLIFNQKSKFNEDLKFIKAKPRGFRSNTRNDLQLQKKQLIFLSSKIIKQPT